MCPWGVWGASGPPPNAHETAKKLVIKQILQRVLGSMTKFKLGHNKFFLLLRIFFCCPMSMKRKKVGHEQGLSVQLNLTPGNLTFLFFYIIFYS